MKFLFAIAFLAALAHAEYLFTYEDPEGNLITEDLDQPIIDNYAVDITKQKFLLYTIKNKATPYELKSGDVSTLQKAGLDCSKETKIVIHGWQNNYQSESVQIIKDAYLATGDRNVILADYKEYNAPYLTAVSNSKKIGANIAQFLNFLDSQGCKTDRMHIVGHSLGSHIGAFCSQDLKATYNKRVMRNTGLDAAGPLFNDKQGDNRLSSDDAAYVDCIHTSTDFGMTNPCGTVDLYPNGGQAQPACLAASKGSGCDHASSYRYFAETILNNNKYPALSCSSVKDAQGNGSACRASSGLLGEAAQSKTSPGIYHVRV